MNLPSDVFIVVEGGEPVAACITEDDVKRVINGKSPRRIKVHQVPLVVTTSRIVVAEK